MIPGLRFTVRRILTDGLKSRLVIPGQLWGRPTDCHRTVDRIGRKHTPDGEHVGLMFTPWRVMGFTLVEVRRSGDDFVVINTLRMNSSRPGDAVHIRPHEASELFVVNVARDFPEGSKFVPSEIKERVDHLYQGELKRTGP